MNRIKSILFLMTSFSLILMFQSCDSNYKLNTSGSALVTAQSTPEVPKPAPTPVPTPTPTPTPVPPAQIPNFSCLTVQVLPYAENMQIPARDASGTCYAVQLFQAIPFGASDLTPTIDTQVISRNHDVSDTNSFVTHNPYLVGQETTTLTFAGVRNIKLAGAADDTTPILVDNFVLVGFGAGVLTPDEYSAYGTSDSTVNGTDGILLENQLVTLTAFASGGTATVTPLDISQTIQAGESYTLDVRAEDCGGFRQLSNIYLLLQ